MSRSLLFGILSLWCSCVRPPAGSESAEDLAIKNLRKSTFKIRTVSQRPDFQRPWTNKDPRNSSGTGFYIGKNMIMSNAHVLANARFISVQRDGDERSIPARITFIAHDCDLALLTVDAPNYFNQMQKLSFSDLPALHSPVAAVGFPMGGEQLSITSGVVSRIEYRRYVHAYNSHHLSIQVDSAINPGNSGGPVIQDGRVIGVAFQSLSGADGTGYVIPTVVVRHFLKDIEDGTYDGYPQLGLSFKEGVTANPATGEFHNLPKSNSGVKLSHVAASSPFAGSLRRDDILMNIDGKQIGSDGMIDWQRERVSFLSWFDSKQLGDPVEFELIRGTSRLTKRLSMQASLPSPNSGNSHENDPEYVVVGGIAFTKLNRSLLKSYGSYWYNEVSPLLKYLYFNGTRDPDFGSRNEYVVASHKLNHPINTYIDLPPYAVVDKVQGKEISSLYELHELTKKPVEKYLMIELFGQGEPLVFPSDELQKAEREILDTYKLGKSVVLKQIGEGVPNQPQNGSK